MEIPQMRSREQDSILTIGAQPIWHMELECIPSRSE